MVVSNISAHDDHPRSSQDINYEPPKVSRTRMWTSSGGLYLRRFQGLIKYFRTLNELGSTNADQWQNERFFLSLVNEGILVEDY